MSVNSGAHNPGQVLGSQMTPDPARTGSDSVAPRIDQQSRLHQNGMDQSMPRTAILEVGTDAVAVQPTKPNPRSVDDQLDEPRLQLDSDADNTSTSAGRRRTSAAQESGLAAPPQRRSRWRRVARGVYWLFNPRRALERVASFGRSSDVLREDPVARWAWSIARRFLQSKGRYRRWIREHDTLADGDRQRIRAHIAVLPKKPLISVVMPVYNTREQWLRDAISSVKSQIYPYWELCIADDASPSPTITRVLAELAAGDPRIKWMRRETNGSIAAATNSALELASGEFVALMDHDDLLAERALYEIAVEINAHPDADLIFSDEDAIDASGRRHNPYFKPDWNLDLFLSHNLVNHLGVYRRSLVREVGGMRVGFEGSQDYDLALRVVGATDADRIRHIPAILYHWRQPGKASFSELHLEKCSVAARTAIREYLHSLTGCAQAEVLPHPTVPNWTRVRWPLPDVLPRVSVIVPTRDRANLLAQCASGVLHRTDYADIELIIVDNDSEEPATDALLSELAQDPRVRIIHFHGEFNYSAINNRAIEHATGEIVVLLNNDIEIIREDWLHEMVSHVLRPQVGAVGAKLLYGDNTVQHAGVALGIGAYDDTPGVAGHVGIGKMRSDPGYFGQYALAREVAACTGACLALRRDVYREVGGLDERNLPVAFNDIDLCIRLRQRGYKIVWTPFAELYHLESASRGPDSNPDTFPRFMREVKYMRDRWGASLDNDPYYNCNFTRANTDFSLAFPAPRHKPWCNQV